MPLILSSDILREKNKLEDGGVFIVLLDIDVPGLDDHIRVTSDSVETVWNGDTYVPFPFELDEISDTSKGEVPQVQLRISNVTRAIEAYIQQYDEYCKENGYLPITVYIYVVHSEHLDEEDPIVEHVFELKQPQTTSMWATFTLSATNLFMKRFPLYRMLKNRCRYKTFKGTLCGYSGSETTCDRTLVRCKELGNSRRFGGFPGLGRAPLYV